MNLGEGWSEGWGEGWRWEREQAVAAAPDAQLRLSLLRRKLKGRGAHQGRGTHQGRGREPAESPYAGLDGEEEASEEEEEAVEEEVVDAFDAARAGESFL